MRRLLLICVCTFTVARLSAADDRLLQWMDRIAQQQLSGREAAIAKIHTLSEAKARQAWARAKILELLGGLPDYHGPLHARVTGRVERSRYTIEKVVFESLPEFYVTADLYLPKAAGKHPAVLIPMGHWEQGKLAAQPIAANLAMKGFVALAYDPVGQGERQQAYDRRIEASLMGGATDQHFQAGAQSILAGENFARYRIWDGMRALDYLVSRPEVDADKLGATGCWGAERSRPTSPRWIRGSRSPRRLATSTPGANYSPDPPVIPSRVSPSSFLPAWMWRTTSSCSRRNPG